MECMISQRHEYIKNNCTLKFIHNTKQNTNKKGHGKPLQETV